SLGQFVVNEYFSDEADEKITYIDVLVSFKNLSLNERHEFLKNQDVESFITQAVVSYEALAEFNYFIKDGSFFDNIGSVVSFIIKIPSQLTMGQKFKTITFSSLINVLNNVHQVLEFSARRSDSFTVEMNKVGDFIQSLEDAKYMTGPLTARTLTFFLKQFSKGWLLTSDQEIGENLNREKLNYVRATVEEWSARQSYINSKYEGRRSLTLEEFSSGNENTDMRRWMTVFEKTALHQWLPDGPVRHSSTTSNLKYEEMTVSNSIYTLVDFFRAPFSKDKPHVLEYSVKKDETQAIYDLLRILGVEMGFVDARVDDTGIKFFLEGNTFTTQLNNNSNLDFYESYELLSTIFSSGMLSENIHKAFVESESSDCVIENQLDVLGFPVLRAYCVREHFKQNFGTYFSQLETFNSYWQNASELDREKLLGVIEMASRGGVISDKPFDMGEIRVMSGTLYYLESAFFNFDSDRNGLITNQETRTAELHFRPLIEDYMVNLGYGDNLDWAQSLFIYLLVRGAVPETNWQQFLYFVQTDIDTEIMFRFQRFSYDKVLRVFGALAYTTGNAHRNRIENFLLTQKDDLFDNLSAEEVPDCRVKENIPFCQWARLIYCNETVNEELFDWMKNAQLLLFPFEAWENNPETTVRNAMINMSSIFRGNAVYSTQCSFPELEPTKTWYQWAADGLDNTWNGTETEKGVWESLEEGWNNLSDFFNGED
ncbi:MAG: hypothetical protein HRT44_06925, partial [Bdellovibrionales bacterium]|nr:hypothetical protein [Bdellovibrionales bacterium]